jgi:DNA-binding PadR family transcriptional regulator
MTSKMREALQDAQRGNLRRVHDTEAAWPAAPNTLGALVRHGLLERTETRSLKGRDVTLWSISDAGREALKPPPPKVWEQRAVFMARPSKGTGDYTLDPRRRIDDLEVVDKEALSVVWAQHAEERHSEAEDKRERARRLANGIRRAA